jgi:hypothetical protein
VEVDGGELCVADFDAFGVFAVVEAGVDGQAGLGGGRGRRRTVALTSQLRQSTPQSARSGPAHRPVLTSLSNRRISDSL